MDAKDLPGDLFVATLKYPKMPRRRLPRYEVGTETRETEPPFRVGYGLAFRIPLTRTALVFGEWTWELEGETEEAKIREALKGSEPNITLEEIKEWT